MGRFLSVFLLVSILAIGTHLVRSQKVSLTSPIPKVFGSNIQSLKSDWLPRGNLTKVNNRDLTISASSAILVNFDTGEIVYQKDAKKEQPVASIAKVMTALVALEAKSPDVVFTVSAKAAGVGEDSMGLTEGEQVSLNELLYGLMLPSGNDAAVTIAEGTSGTEDAFVTQMNSEARDLGMKDTKFINASGLDEDGREQYSTAYDLVVLTHYAWSNFPLFRQVASTEHITIDANADHKVLDLYNQTNLLTTYPGVQGIKPGFTWNAGWCLLTYAENNNVRLVGVILGSGDRRGEMKELLDYGFGKFGIRVSHPALDL
jgi:D-alanyl-D-alanine carboxypeptidase (penicillin-binding protein 5/6)